MTVPFTVAQFNYSIPKLPNYSIAESQCLDRPDVQFHPRTYEKNSGNSSQRIHRSYHHRPASGPGSGRRDQHHLATNDYLPGEPEQAGQHICPGTQHLQLAIADHQYYFHHFAPPRCLPAFHVAVWEECAAVRSRGRACDAARGQHTRRAQGIMKRSRVFRISIRSVLAGFLLFFGFAALIRGARYPIALGVIHATNWIIRRGWPDSAKLSTPQVTWIILSADLIFGIVFLVLGLRIGSRSRSPQPGVRSTGGSVS